MKIKTMSKVLAIVLALSALLQTGYTLLSIVQAQTAASAGGTEAAVNIDIPQDVLDKLKSSDPSHYDTNLANYKKLLVALDVHGKFKREIERLILEGHRLPDLLIAYEFLNQNYGKMQDLETMVKFREAGKTWDAVFTGYNKDHAAFVPRSFDSDYLEGLMKTPGFTPDDIMIADRLAFVSGKPVKDLIAGKLESQNSWKEIAADLDILHSASALPRVQITAQQLKQYTVPGTFAEAKVTAAFVLAQKIGKSPETVIGKMQAGMTDEAIMAESYIETYDKF